MNERLNLQTSQTEFITEFKNWMDGLVTALIHYSEELSSTGTALQSESESECQQCPLWYEVRWMRVSVDNLYCGSTNMYYMSVKHAPWPL